jgi:hypothetical protein
MVLELFITEAHQRLESRLIAEPVVAAHFDRPGGTLSA